MITEKPEKEFKLTLIACSQPRMHYDDSCALKVNFVHVWVHFLKEGLRAIARS